MSGTLILDYLGTSFKRPRVERRPLSSNPAFGRR
jgi:hypothetical protein